MHRDTKYIHCDIKPENIMTTNYQTYDAKLIDFGATNKIKCMGGTYIFLPPEE